MTEPNKTIRPKSFCDHCRSKLIHKSKFKAKDPWMSLEIMAMMFLINAAFEDKNYHIKYGQDPEGINMINCLGCFVPSKLDQVIKIALSDKSLKKLKEEIDKVNK